ncbi:MAG: helix-turn-helix domain-containing protein [Phenylobacterium sp.]|uniref:MerR family transcriptional regulator n=1 Tax=Phenylobacterium sp. TaxID=1871053 RepID=UPI002736C0B1|nr:helix-turn-helix domain-containing protein [Phenylobacterium sp.]MDP3747362.1 helix-turn-helix domain-containing protein [Phenylobacterium sp.]
MSPRQGLTIGRLAAAAGVNLETVRYYERIGLMPLPDRTVGGHRSYRPEHRSHLAFIRRARELGFTLDDIRALLALAEPGRQSCAVVKTIASDHLRNVHAKIADLSRLAGVLEDAVRQCGDGDVPECPVIQVLGGA